MNFCARFLCLAPLLLFLTAAEGEEPKPTEVDQLAKARQIGWQTALMVVERFETTKTPGFPGIDAWVAEFRKQTKGLEPDADPRKWPKIDVDALTTHSPSFWRAYYELAPGDPGAAMLYGGILMGGGETIRARRLLELQKYRPGMPKEAIETFIQLYGLSGAAGRASDQIVEEGIKLFDGGDYDAAAKKYHDAIAAFPQNGWAYYELAYTVRVKDAIAAGQKPQLPPDGKLLIEINPEKPVPYSAEAKKNYALCRRYSPFMAAAYQGDDQEIIRSALAFGENILPAMKELGETRDPVTIDRLIERFAKGCQDAGLHDFALLGRQMIVARRGQYDATDHPFIVTSLRALAPGPDTEVVLDRLAGKQIATYRLIATEDQVSGAAAPAPGEKQSQK